MRCLLDALHLPPRSRAGRLRSAVEGWTVSGAVRASHDSNGTARRHRARASRLLSSRVENSAWTRSRQNAQSACEPCVRRRRPPRRRRTRRNPRAQQLSRNLSRIRRTARPELLGFTPEPEPKRVRVMRAWTSTRGSRPLRRLLHHQCAGYKTSARRSKAAVAASLAGVKLREWEAFATTKNLSTRVITTRYARALERRTRSTRCADSKDATD